MISSGCVFSTIEVVSSVVSGSAVEGCSTVTTLVSSFTFDVDFFLVFLTSLPVSTTSGKEGLRGCSISTVSLISGISKGLGVGVDSCSTSGWGFSFLLGLIVTSVDLFSSTTEGLRLSATMVSSTVCTLSTVVGVSSLGLVFISISSIFSRVKSSKLLAALRSTSGDEGMLSNSSSLGSISSSSATGTSSFLVIGMSASVSEAVSTSTLCFTPTLFCSVIQVVEVWGMESGITGVGTVDSANRITSCVRGKQFSVVSAAVSVCASSGRDSNGVSLTKVWTSLT